MTVVYAGNGIYLGLVADTKPTTGVATNAVFITTDKPTIHYYNGSSWVTDAASTTSTNTFSAVQTFTAVPIINGGTGYTLTLERTTSTAGIDVGIGFNEQNASSAPIRYAAFLGGIATGGNTAGAEIGSIKFQTMVAGTLTTIFLVDGTGNIRLGVNQRLRFSETGLTTSRTYSWPDATTTVVGTDTAQTVSGKTISDLKETWVDKSSAYTMTDTDYGITLSGTGTYTVTLPAVATRAGRIYQFKKTGASGTVTIDGNASETIDGATTKALNTQWDKLKIMCTGTEWLIIA